MPFIQRNVPAVNDLVELDAPEEYPTQNILDFAAQRTMVGLLEQMQIFSAHATDIFTDIFEAANDTFRRIQGLSEKVAQLSERIPEVEEFYKVTPVQRLFENQRLMTSWKQNEDSQLFRPETNAACVAEMFKDAYPPPNLEIMDPLMENGESALRKYTDPMFFVTEWVQAMEKQNEEARKARREKRKNRKQQQVGQRQVAVKKNVATIAKYVYDPNTGEKILVQQASGGSSAQQQEITAGTYIAQGSTDIDTNAVLSAAATQPEPSHAEPSSGHHHKKHKKDDTPASPASPAAPAAPPAPAAPTAPPAPTAPAAPAAPAAPMAPPAPAAPAAPPAPAAPAAPPPPGAPAAVGGGGMGDLAAQLGAAHLKSAPAPTKKVEARTDLMNMIRQGKKLRSAQDRVLADAVPSKSDQPAALSVADILSRRIAVADSDDEDDDDDDEWD